MEVGAMVIGGLFNLFSPMPVSNELSSSLPLLPLAGE